MKSSKQSKVVIVSLVLSGILTLCAMAIPYNTYQETIYRKDITANYLFAGAIEIKNECIGASAELCTYLALNPQLDSDQVDVYDYLLHTVRIPSQIKPPDTKTL